LQGVGHEQEEFAEFYRASRDSCLRAVTAVVADRQLAEELVAEAFARAWTSWGKVRRHPAPRGWVVRTALNTGVSWWRRRREVPLADHDAAAPADTSGGVDPALIAALRRLPARQREVLALRILLDLDTETTDFAEALTDEWAGRRLAKAIQGQGAFRRFKDQLHEEHSGLLPLPGRPPRSGCALSLTESPARR
jgi:DNA-directed RNA polymerase specialized sigma24 family protein